MRLRLKAIPAFAACVLFFAAPHATSAAERVRIGYVKGYAPAVIAVVAKNAGYFEKLGIDAEIMTFGGGGAAGEALAAGALDVGQVPIFALAPGIKRGMDARLVSQNSEAAIGYYLMTLPSSPYKTIKDLDGKKVGITAAGSTTDGYARYIASKYGVTFTTVAVGVAGMQALERKQIDAVIGYPSNGDQARLARTAVVVSDFAQDIPPHTDDLWAATGRMIRDRPQVLRKVLSALHGATAKLQSDRPYALKALKEFMGDQVSDDLVGVTYDTRIVKMSVDGRINPDAVAMTVKLQLSTGVDPATLAQPTDIYVTNFTPVTPYK